MRKSWGLRSLVVRGCQGGRCVQRIEVIVKMQQKRGWGSVRGGTDQGFEVVRGWGGGGARRLGLWVI